MALSEALRNHLALANLDAVENAWLAHLEENPTDLDFFTEVARAVATEAGDPSTAELLLDMLDESLQGDELWPARLKLMRAVGDLMFQGTEMHEEILFTLEKTYGERTSFALLVEKVGLKRAVNDTAKTWQKADRLETLLSYDVGTIVHMEGKGSGLVTDVNMALESFLVTFEQIGALRVGFAAAAKLLRPLPLGHILRRKHDDRASLETLRDEQPAELLRNVLESYDAPRTGAEVRRDLAGLVTEKGWSSWWAAARKHPQVLAVRDGRRSYRWAASTADADEEVWRTFERGALPARIEMLRRHGSREKTLADRMCVALARNARQVERKDPGSACAAWLALEKHQGQGTDATTELEELIATTQDLRILARGVDDRTNRERFYELVHTHREDWLEGYAGLLIQESDARPLDHLAALLDENDVLGPVLDTLLTQPRRSPGAFVWLVERSASHDSWRQRNPLRLLEQTLWALADSPTFGVFRVRLQTSVESGGALPRLIGDLTAEQAGRGIRAIERSGGIERYQRDPLISAIQLKFPALREDDEQPLYATADMITIKRAELKALLEEEIPTNRKAIEEARELGDLRENFEYKSARQRHEYLAARAASMDGELTRVRPIDPSMVSGKEVVIGSRVTLVGDDGTIRMITILGPWNSDPENNVLSNESDLAKSMLTMEVGKTLDIAGAPMRIERIERWDVPPAAR
jgi:transcription elongation GreA/GreB family factor